MGEPGAQAIRRRVQVADPVGLTLGAAARFVAAARRYRAEILVFDGSRGLSGKSLFDMATLLAPCGTPLDLEACGPDAQEAISALAGLLASLSHGAREG